MVQKLEIQGELVQVVETQVVRQIKLQDFMPLMVKEMPVTLPVLPRTAVFVHYDPTHPTQKRINFLCEVPAGIKTITKDNKHIGSKRRYRLSFPWTYFWITAVSQGARLDSFAIDNYKCLHSREKFSKLPGEFRVAFLPNIYHDSGEICFGATGAPVGSLADQVDDIVNSFYLTEFNDDLDRSEMVWPFGGNNLKNWVEATEKMGTAAYKNMPEWDNSARRKFTIDDLIGSASKIRTTKIEGSVIIPEIPTPMTFGRAEEWLRNLSPQDRGRIKVAMGNLIEDEPEEFIVEPTAFAEVADDGGVPV